MIELILTIHHYNAYLIILAGLVVGIWGLILYFTHRPMLRSWRNALLIAAGLGLLQGLLGLLLVALGLKPGLPTDERYYLHYVYGALVALGIPIAYSYASGNKNPRLEILIYSLAALILVTAAGTRAWMTGPAVLTFP